MSDRNTTDGPHEGQSGPERFTRRYPKTAGLLGFLLAAIGGSLVSGIIGGLSSAAGSSQPRAVAGLGGLVTLTLFVLIPVWGYRRAGGSFLTGFFMPFGVLLVLVGGCIALLISSFSA
ncbi:MAG: hypothetical protein OEM97_10090 [Acidimicrobiia bacterium]|nr:hypothetical protein [Acidimicrobiia bacterium]